MKIEITTELVNKLKDYCRVSAASLNNDNLTRAYQYYAEEALSDLLLRWHKKNIKGDWKEKQLNDNFYFISCKNTVRNMIAREDRNKVKVMKDFNNTSLDAPTDNDESEIEIKSNYSKDIEEVKDKEQNLNKKLNLIVKSLETSQYMEPWDKTVFVETFIERKMIKEVAKKNGLSKHQVKDSRARIRNIINREYNKQL
jgi:hypothetical protein